MSQYPSIGPAASTQSVAPGTTVAADSAWHTIATINLTLLAARSLLLTSYVTWQAFFDEDANNPETRIVVDGTAVTLTVGMTAQEQVTQAAHALVNLAAGPHTIELQGLLQVDNSQDYPIGIGALSALVCN